jgi:hypothetical protein
VVPDRGGRKVAERGRTAEDDEAEGNELASRGGVVAIVKVRGGVGLQGCEVTGSIREAQGCLRWPGEC